MKSFFFLSRDSAHKNKSKIHEEFTGSSNNEAQAFKRMKTANNDKNMHLVIITEIIKYIQELIGTIFLDFEITYICIETSNVKEAYKKLKKMRWRNEIEKCLHSERN